VLDANAHVAPPLLLEALAELSRGDVLALPAGPRGGVHCEHHGDGRLVDADRRQRFRALEIGDGVADVDVLDAGYGHDVPRTRARDLDPLEAAPAVDLRDLHRRDRSVRADPRVGARSRELAVL